MYSSNYFLVVVQRLLPGDPAVLRHDRLILPRREVACTTAAIQTLLPLFLETRTLLLTVPGGRPADSVPALQGPAPAAPEGAPSQLLLALQGGPEAKTGARAYLSSARTLGVFNCWNRDCSDQVCGQRRSCCRRCNSSSSAQRIQRP